MIPKLRPTRRGASSERMANGVDSCKQQHSINTCTEMIAGFQAHSRGKHILPLMFLLLFVLLTCFLDGVWARVPRAGHVHHQAGQKIHVEKPDQLEEDTSETETKKDKKEGENVQEEIDREDGEDEEEKYPECPGCAQQAKLTDDEIHQLLIQDIKRQILNKLRLKAPPNVTTPLSSLPIPLTMDDATRRGDEFHREILTRDMDDYYGRTERIIILPNDTNGYECSSKHSYPAICVYFLLGKELPNEDLATVELWVYKERERRNLQNQTLLIADTQINEHHKHKHFKHRIVETETIRKSGWTKFDVKHIIKRWIHHHQNNINGLEITCPTCGKETDVLPISSTGKHRPFLLLTTNEGNVRSRTKRSTTCTAETTQCCREHLYVSFHEMGWDSWIIQPQGYIANYCRGSCTEEGAIPLGNSHSTILMRMAQKNVKIVPCCTPTSMSSLSMLYTDNGSNIYHRILPNMIVESCGCS